MPELGNRNVKGKAIKASSDSEEFSHPAIVKSSSQFKTKKNESKVWRDHYF